MLMQTQSESRIGNGTVLLGFYPRTPRRARQLEVLFKTQLNKVNEHCKSMVLNMIIMQDGGTERERVNICGAENEILDPLFFCIAIRRHCQF